MKIKKIKAKPIFNSRGEPTIEITVNRKFTASAPSGASIGKHEVKAFPSEGIPIDFVNKELNKGLKGFKINTFKDFEDLEEVLFKFDDTRRLTKIGGNTIIALEFALLKALSKNKIWEFLNPKAKKIPMPVGNCVGGGMHFKGTSTDIQEFLVIPKAKKIVDAAFVNALVYKKIGKLLNSSVKTDEGAWVTDIGDDKVLDLLNKVVEQVVREIGIEINLGIDVAASRLFENNFYVYRTKRLNRKQQIAYMNSLINKYNLFYVEDGLEEEDFDGFKEINSELNVGDDLICTNLERLKKSTVSSVIVKPNQIGSIVKTKKLIDYCKENNITPIMSHRSGETMDTTLSHLAVGWQCPFIKCGISGKERSVKINELKYIEREM